MTAIEFAKRFIRFEKTSPVTGDFRIEMYPFLKGPLDASDDIRIKRLVIYKASSCLGTVLGQIINAKRIAQEVGDQIMVCQTDDDASKWTKTRGKEWLESIPDVVRLLKNDKYAQTNDLWLFRHKFLKISGPGITAAQSDQVRYVQTDESHLEAYPPGRLVEWEKRMGARWDRQATHITTAANEGKEVDQFYYQGTQNEWHWRCVKCNNLVWALWEEDAQVLYNGEKVFRWQNLASDTMTLDSVHAVCPHCQKAYYDNSRDRFSLQRDADYVAMNPNAPIEFASYRWSALAAAHWMPWRDLLSEYLAALFAFSKMGDLKPLEDWEKKRLCKSYIPKLPNIGQGDGSNDYKLGSIWVVDNSLRVCSFDVQDQDGFHLWGQVDQFTPDGNSRRIAYDKLLSWDEARAFQQHHQSLDKDTYMDAGHRMREVFGVCAKWYWFALFSEDEDEFVNMETNPSDLHGPLIPVRRPFTKPVMEDSMSGKRANVDKSIVIRIGHKKTGIPTGFCLSRRWSKPTIGSYLMALKSGNTGRYYGIASDISPDFTAQLNSYAFAKLYNKTRGTTEVILKQIKTQDHAFSAASMCLLGAVIRGYYPLSNINNEPKLEEAAA